MLQTPSRATQRLSLAEPLRTWAATPSEYPRDKSVVQLFEQVTAAHPEGTALLSNSLEVTRPVTYEELNRRANRLAQELRARGVGSETLVGLCVDGPEMVVAILAILKAGGAYVPFDNAYPRERVKFMLDDTRAPLFITQKSAATRVLQEVLQERHTATLFLDEEFGRDAGDTPNLTLGSSPNSLAYVMYTSGSTGRPKGVLVEHRSIVRLVCNTGYCEFGPYQVFLQSSPVSVWELGRPTEMRGGSAFLHRALSRISA